MKNLIYADKMWTGIQLGTYYCPGACTTKILATNYEVIIGFVGPLVSHRDRIIAQTTAIPGPVE